MKTIGKARKAMKTNGTTRKQEGKGRKNNEKQRKSTGTAMKSHRLQLEKQ